MNFVSKSLFQSNAVIIFDDPRYQPPDSSLILSWFTSAEATGARVLDDPYIHTKVITLPVLKIKVVLEPNRLLIYDESQDEHTFDRAAKELLRLYEIGFKGLRLGAVGFNFDVYYHFANVVRINDVFAEIFGKITEQTNDLIDMGWQFSLDADGGKRRETYFFKVTAPLDIATHVNHHLPLNKLPTEKEFLSSCKKSYDRADELVNNLNL